jgi:hypothetical protein
MDSERNSRMSLLRPYLSIWPGSFADWTLHRKAGERRLPLTEVGYELLVGLSAKRAKTAIATANLASHMGMPSSPVLFGKNAESAAPR